MELSERTCSWQETKNKKRKTEWDAIIWRKRGSRKKREREKRNREKRNREKSDHWQLNWTDNKGRGNKVTVVYDVYTQPIKEMREEMQDILFDTGRNARTVKASERLRLPPVLSPSSHRAWAEWPASQTPQGLHQKVYGTSTEAHDTRTDWAPVVLLAQGGQERSPRIKKKKIKKKNKRWDQAFFGCCL
jgi:hypothetical protein